MPTLFIQKPTLVLDPTKVQRNIDRMVSKAQNSGVIFRPHFKTHQSTQIGEWFCERGVTRITVSSVDMATYFADNGWTDITIAFPVNILEIEAIKALAKRITLGLLVESTETLQFLAQHLQLPVNIWLKADIGYHRTGILWTAPERFVSLAQSIKQIPHFTLQGILNHAGHTYAARSQAEVERLYQEMVSRMQSIRMALVTAGFTDTQLSIGDTPSCSLVDDLSAVDEIRPGNFVFYDVTQLEIGACRAEDIGLVVACPIVAKHPERNQLVLYGGAVHHSKEFIEVGGTKIFGYVTRLIENGWEARLDGAYVAGLSQEHGLVTMPSHTLTQFKVGDVLAILPVHSCLTVNLLRMNYLTTQGEWYAA